MSLLLCRREPVKHPFYIEVLGIHIYSSQELCYVICNHPLLVMDGFVGKALYSFVKMSLAWALWQAGWKSFRKPEAARKRRCTCFDRMRLLYGKESQRFRQTAAAYRSLPAPRYEKAVADYLFGKNSMAVLLSAMRSF